MVYLANNPYRSSDIYHHGIKGQRWGVRRFQNPDGTLTEAGKKRYDRYMKSVDRGNKIINSDKSGRELKRPYTGILGRSIAGAAGIGALATAGKSFSSYVVSHYGGTALASPLITPTPAMISVVAAMGLGGIAVNAIREAVDVHNAKKYNKETTGRKYQKAVYA